jgi:hypothetical protein
VTPAPPGLRHALHLDVEVGAPIARLLRDEPVDPQRIYFRSSPTFETSSERLAGLTTRLFVGSGTRHPRSVVFDFYEVL